MVILIVEYGLLRQLVKNNISQTKPIDVKEYVGFMKHHLNRSQATINKFIAALKTFFNYLFDHSHIQDNPMTRIKIQKVQQTEEAKGVSKWLIKEEQQRFITYVELEKNEFKRLRNLAIIDLMLYCGLRVSEVEDLKGEDVRLNGNIDITIREGKHGKYATVMMVEKYCKNLRKWLKYRQSLTCREFAILIFIYLYKWVKLTFHSLKHLLFVYKVIKIAHTGCGKWALNI